MRATPLTVASPYFTPQQVREIHEACFEVLLNLADAVAEADDTDEAIALLDRASWIGIDSTSYQRRRAAYLDQRGDKELATAARNRARAGSGPRSASDCFLLGVDLCQEGRQRAALEQFEQAVTQQPDHYGADYALAVCYLRSRDGRADQAHLALARASLNQCINQQPDHVWPYLLRGFTHGERGDFVAAEADFRLAEQKLSEAPDDAARYGVLVNRGVLRIREKDFRAAVADLTAAVRFQPEEYAAYVNLADAYQGLKRLGRRDGPARSGAGPGTAERPGCHLPHPLPPAPAARRPGAALDDLAAALRHEPANSAEAAADQQERGDLCLEQRRYEAAVAAYDEALAIQPERPGVQRARADALLHLNRTKEAIQALDRCLANDRTGVPAQVAVYQRAAGPTLNSGTTPLPRRTLRASCNWIRAGPRSAPSAAGVTWPSTLRPWPSVTSATFWMSSPPAPTP